MIPHDFVKHFFTVRGETGMRILKNILISFAEEIDTDGDLYRFFLFLENLPGLFPP